MKAVVFAGGAAYRLSKFIGSYNKHLLPIYDDDTVIEKGLKNLIKAGINEFLFITNDGLEDIFFFFIKDKYKLHSSQLIVRSSKKKILPLADVLLEAKDYIEGQDFILFLGDNLFLPALDSELKETPVELIKELIPLKNTNWIVMAESVEPKHFGVIKFKDSQNKIIDHIEEKPDEIGVRWVVTGLSRYNPEVMKIAELLIVSKDENRSLSDIHNILINEKKLNIRRWTGQWFDIGTSERYFQSLDSLQKTEGKKVINIDNCPLAAKFLETKFAERIVKLNWEVKHGQVR